MYSGKIAVPPGGGGIGRIIKIIKLLVIYYHIKSVDVDIQGVIEMCDQILTTRYWLHVELGKNI
jgi:hypothetical protein